MTSILDKIVATKKQHVEQAKERISRASLEAQLANAAPPRDFFAALSDAGNIHLIAEVKKASPSAGVIRDDFDPVAIAQTYEAHGATCISVLTDEPYFQGHLDYLTAIRQQVRIPLLRKDFIIDPYQVIEARVAGADALLLIAECLDDCRLRGLCQTTLELGMTPLVEFYEPENLPRALESGADLIGINNRNLKTFETDLNHCIGLRQQIPAEMIMVAESGIRNHQDVQRLIDAGIQAMLVGEHLMRHQDIGRAVEQLLHDA